MVQLHPGQVVNAHQNQYAEVGLYFSGVSFLPSSIAIVLPQSSVGHTHLFGQLMSCLNKCSLFK